MDSKAQAPPMLISQHFPYGEVFGGKNNVDFLQDPKVVGKSMSENGRYPIFSR